MREMNPSRAWQREVERTAKRGFRPDEVARAKLYASKDYRASRPERAPEEQRAAYQDVAEVMASDARGPR